MTKRPIVATTVNHVTVDITASPDTVWRAIQDEYVAGRKFSEMGYSIEPLDDPAAALGGYRILLEQKGRLVDDRIFSVTECDEAARRLSLFVNYVSVLDGIMHVYATYHAQEIPSGTRYAIHCHARVRLEAPMSSAKEAVAVWLAERKAQFDTDLIEYLTTFKLMIEAGS